MNFTGKVVLITGADIGIGAASAAEFGKLGAKLVLVGRQNYKLDEIRQRCLADNASLEFLLIVTDLEEEQEIQRIFKETITKFQRIDVLVNAMSSIENGSIETTSIDQYDRLMNLNLRAVFYLTMLVASELVKTKGCIVNVSSVAGFRPFSNILVYALSVAALDQFTRCVSLELAGKGVRCNSVRPSLIDADNVNLDSMDQTTKQKFLDHSKRVHALRRLGRVEEIASVICFLASDLASFITGANIPVDGGRHGMGAN